VSAADIHTAAAPAAAGPVYLMVQAWPVAEQLPDADLDVLIFDGPDTEAQLGAYMGHDEEGDGQPIWVEAQGAGVAGVTHWAEMPKLTGAVLAPVVAEPSQTAELLARAQRAEGERAVLLSLLQQADEVLSTLDGDDITEQTLLEQLRARILRACMPLRPAEAGLLGIRAALTTRQCSNDERKECDNYPCEAKGACQGRYL